ncbi:alpha/beta fold hydrolase, partial [Candidatus Woesearchaeota archaeon]|nr:alpha/beta fold hydrolase [Candidatus Woesearchaeota archaeon]
MEMNVIIQSTNNISLAGVMHLPPNQSEEKEKKIVVICHGFMSSKDVDRFVYYADEFSKKGYNALRFDFSGCGESDKALISVKQEVDDLLAIIYFCNERGFDEIALMGHSLGCLICLEAYPKAG